MNGVNHIVVLYKRKVGLYKINQDPAISSPSKPWEDGDEKPQVETISTKEWPEKVDQTETTYTDLANSGKIFEIAVSSSGKHDVMSELTKFKESELTEASSMVVVPIYVRWDEEFQPEDLIKTDNSIDYDSPEIVGRPLEGGQWFYHILISHKTKTPRRHQELAMTALRIKQDVGGNTKLVQLMSKKNVYMGQFQNPNVKQNVVAMKSFHVGRESYLVTASKKTFDSLQGSDVVESFRIVERQNVKVTEHGVTTYLEPKILGEVNPISVNEVIAVEIIEFSVSATILLVLDLENGGNCRLRVFSFNPANANPYLELNRRDFSHAAFKNLHSFKHQGGKYFVMSGSSLSGENKAVIAQVLT